MNIYEIKTDLSNSEILSLDQIDPEGRPSLRYLGLFNQIVSINMDINQIGYVIYKNNPLTGERGIVQYFLKEGYGTVGSSCPDEKLG